MAAGVDNCIADGNLLHSATAFAVVHSICYTCRNFCDSFGLDDYQKKVTAPLPYRIFRRTHDNSVSRLVLFFALPSQLLHFERLIHKAPCHVHRAGQRLHPRQRRTYRDEQLHQQLRMRHRVA